MQTESSPISNEHNLAVIKNEIQFLEEMISKNPLKPPQYYKNECLKNNHHFSASKINNTLSRIRKEMFPSGSEIIFSAKFCSTKDNTPFLQGRFIFNNEQDKRKSKDHQIHDEIIVLGSKFFIKILADATRWYVDATFKVTPRGFYQLLIIMCNHEPTNKYIPCLFLLMTSKNEVSYMHAMKIIKCV